MSMLPGSIYLGDIPIVEIGIQPGTYADGDHRHPATHITDGTAAGRALFTAADTTAQRTALGLLSAALRDAGTGANQVLLLNLFNDIDIAGSFLSSKSNSANGSIIRINGAWFAGGTSTTTKPTFVLEPSGTTSTGWDTAGTGFGVNAPSGFLGRLLDLQQNGVSRLLVSSNGQLHVGPSSSTGFSVNVTSTTFGRRVRVSNDSGGIDLRLSNNGRLFGLDVNATGQCSLFQDDSTKTLTVSSAGPLAFSGTSNQVLGTWFTGGTSTTTKPHFLIEPAGTTSTGWSTAGTGLGVNAPSGFTGRLLDLQVNGTSVLNVNNVGDITGRRLAFSDSIFPTGGSVYIQANILRAGSTTALSFTDTVSAIVGNPDLFVLRDASNTLAQRNGTNAQTFRLYNTFTDASNFERLSLGWSGNVLNIANQAAGTGTLRSIAFSANGAANTPPALFTGTWFTGGTSTTTKPHLLIEPAGTTSTGWSTAGTAFGVNAASGFTGRLLDLQQNGISVFNVSNTGRLSNATIGNLRESTFVITDAAGFEINPLNGPMQRITLGANRTPVFTFLDGQSVKLKVNFGAFNLTYTGTGGPVVWIGGVAPVPPASGWMHLSFWNEGGVLHGSLLGNTAS